MPIRPSTTAAGATAIPFESYAQLVRNLIPSTQKICFFDSRARSLWSSDRSDESEWRMHVELVLHRARNNDHRRSDPPVRAGDGITQVLPVIAMTGDIVGALALVLRHMPANMVHRRTSTIERLLAPLLAVLAHGWRESSPSNAPAAEPATATLVRREMPRLARRTDVIGPASRVSSAPALLRRVVSTASSQVDCAFAALFATSRAIALTHRVRAQESQVDLLAIVDAVRQPMARLVRDRHTAVATSSIDPPRVPGVSYKFATCPLRASDGELVALLAVFRQRRETDFGGDDLATLEQIAAQVPRDVLRELMPVSARPINVDPIATDAVLLADDEPTTVDAIPCPVEPMPSRVEATTVEPSTQPIVQSLEARIRHALRNDGLVLYTQRISNLRAASTTARYEVLLRLRDAPDADLPPDFWDVATAYELSPELDRWALGRLLKALRAHPNLMQDSKVEFAINVSAASVLRGSFGDFVESQLFRSGVPAQALLFEFRESDAIEHAVALEGLTGRLHALGCRIALDRCRQGLDIFRTIRRWPVSCLKLDAALTQGVATDADAAHRVREVVEVASDIGMETIGAHVEDEIVRAKLAELRIDFAQGFHLAQPEPLTNLVG